MSKLNEMSGKTLDIEKQNIEKLKELFPEIMTEDNVLVYRVERKSKFSKILYKPYDKEEIRSRTRFVYGQNKFDRCWRELTKHCLKRIKYYENWVWAVNPAVINKCGYIPIWLCDEFKEYMTPHLTASTIKKLQNKIDNLYWLSIFVPVKSINERITRKPNTIIL